VPEATTPALRCAGVTKRFGSTVAVDLLDLEVAAGRITALLGPSGCGKTTALRLIAGLEDPDAGVIEIDGDRVADAQRSVAPEHRRTGMVFQDYALFPHLSVTANVEFGLVHLPRRARRSAAAEALDLVGLGDLAHRAPSELSGGQQQRVALARALAPSPRIVLLDEPFSNLDAALRTVVREDVRRILNEARATAVFVTHDQEEALSLADDVAVMSDGRIHQIAPPHQLYTEPTTRFVARFVGDADVLPASRVGGNEVQTSLGRLVTTGDVVAHAVEVVVRPESVRLRPDGDGSALVDSVTYFGHDQLIRLTLPDGTVVRSRQGPELHLRPGDRVEPTVVGPVVALQGPAEVAVAAPA
jgi:iron(III) transport system ATP-binding protein